MILHRKKQIMILLITSILFTFILPTSFVIGETNNFVTINVDILNVRSGPGLDEDVVAKVYMGEKYPIIEEKNNWIKIKLNNNSEGWVASWLVEKGSEQTSLKSAEATVDNLNVRSGPSTSFAIIDQIHPDKKYPVIEQQGEWVKIQLNADKSGWVASWLVKITDESPSEQTLEKELVTVQADTLNVRSGPAVSYDILGKLKKGDQVEVVSVQDGWYKIVYNSGFGWIASEFASKSNTSTEPKTENNTNKKLMVNAENVNLRSGPSTNNKILKTLNYGEILNVLEASGEWYKVSLESSPTTIGWVINWYVVEYNQVSNQPTVTILYPSTNLREAPSTTSAVIARANEGDQFPILAVEGEWYKIQLPDKRVAYVAGWIVSTSGISQDISHGVDDSLTGKTIVIDAGHGGKDIGATGSHFKSYEKELNLKVAKLLQKKLEAAGATVIMTRTTDVKIALEDRTYIASKNDADAFISIHHNTNSDESINGTITYYYDDYDKQLASKIQTEIVKSAGTKDLNARYGDYFVLRENTQLSVLVELAFISNYQDELKARSEKFQENAAEGIFQGLIKYF